MLDSRWYSFFRGGNPSLAATPRQSAPPTAYGSVHAFPKCLLSGEHHDDSRVFGFCFSPLNVERTSIFFCNSFFVTVPAPCCPIDGSERSSQAAVNDLIAENGALSNRQSERVLCFLFCFWKKWSTIQGAFKQQTWGLNRQKVGFIVDITDLYQLSYFASWLSGIRYWYSSYRKHIETKSANTFGWGEPSCRLSEIMSRVST